MSDNIISLDVVDMENDMTGLDINEVFFQDDIIDFIPKHVLRNEREYYDE
jgi:hypothetical protein